MNCQTKFVNAMTFGIDLADNARQQNVYPRWMLQIIFCAYKFASMFGGVYNRNVCCRVMICSMNHANK